MHKNAYLLIIPWLLAACQPAIQEQYVTTTSGARVRDQPSSKGRDIGLIAYGQPVSVYTKQEQVVSEQIGWRNAPWIKVRYQDRDAWVYGGLIGTKSDLALKLRLQEQRKSIALQVIRSLARDCGTSGEPLEIGPGEKVNWCTFNTPGSYRRGRFEVEEAALALGAWSDDPALFQAASGLDGWKSGFFEDPNNRDKLLSAYEPLMGILKRSLGEEALTLSDHPGSVFETTPYTEKIFDALYLEPSFALAPGLTAKAFFEKALGPSSAGTLGASIVAYEKHGAAAERVCADKNKGQEDPAWLEIQETRFALPDGSTVSADIYDFCFVLRRSRDGSLPLLKRMLSRILHDYMPSSARQITF